MNLKDLFSFKPDKNQQGLFAHNVPPGLSTQELVAFMKEKYPSMDYMRCKKCRDFVKISKLVAHENECATVKY